MKMEDKQASANAQKPLSPLREKCPGAWSAGFDDRPWALVGGLDDLQAYQEGKAARLALKDETK